MIYAVLIFFFVLGIGTAAGIFWFADVLVSSPLPPSAPADAGSRLAEISAAGKLRDMIVQETAKSALQLSVAAVLGGVIKMMIDRQTEKRHEAAARANVRKEVARRLKETEIAVARARSGLALRRSIDWHDEQVGKLSDAEGELRVIAQTLRFAPETFRGRDAEISAAIEKMADGLAAIVREWEAISPETRRTEATGRAADALERIPTSSPRLMAFLAPEGAGSFEETYRRIGQGVLARIDAGEAS
jgi:hypothetical protein